MIKIYQYQRIINDKKIEAFHQNLYQYDWNTIESHHNTNKTDINFIVTFSLIYNICMIYNIFSYEKKIKTKTKDLESPWITKGIKKIS